MAGANSHGFATGNSSESHNPRTFVETPGGPGIRVNFLSIRTLFVSEARLTAVRTQARGVVGLGDESPWWRPFASMETNLSQGAEPITRALGRFAFRPSSLIGNNREAAQVVMTEPVVRRAPSHGLKREPAYADMLAALRRSFWGAGMNRHPTLRPHRTKTTRLIESLTTAA